MKTIEKLNNYDVLGAIIKVENTFKEVLMNSPFPDIDYVLDDISDEIFDISNILGFTLSDDYWLNNLDNVKITRANYLDGLWSVCLGRRGCSEDEIKKLLESRY